MRSDFLLNMSIFSVIPWNSDRLFDCTWVKTFIKCQLSSCSLRSFRRVFWSYSSYPDILICNLLPFWRYMSRFLLVFCFSRDSAKNCFEVAKATPTFLIFPSKIRKPRSAPLARLDFRKSPVRVKDFWARMSLRRRPGVRKSTDYLYASPTGSFPWSPP